MDGNDYNLFFCLFQQLSEKGFYDKYKVLKRIEYFAFVALKQFPLNGKKKMKTKENAILTLIELSFFVLCYSRKHV